MCCVEGGRCNPFMGTCAAANSLTMNVDFVPTVSPHLAKVIKRVAALPRQTLSQREGLLGSIAHEECSLALMNELAILESYLRDGPGLDRIVSVLAKQEDGFAVF